MLTLARFALQLARHVQMLEGTTIKDGVNVKDEYWVEGNDINSVSQSAASVHGACLVRNKDIRKFLDGQSLLFSPTHFDESKQTAECDWSRVYRYLR